MQGGSTLRATISRERNSSASYAAIFSNFPGAERDKLALVIFFHLFTLQYVQERLIRTRHTCLPFSLPICALDVTWKTCEGASGCCLLATFRVLDLGSINSPPSHTRQCHIASSLPSFLRTSVFCSTENFSNLLSVWCHSLTWLHFSCLIDFRGAVHPQMGTSAARASSFS